MSRVDPPFAALELGLLEQKHNVAEFTSGVPLLDDWLRKYAWPNQRNGSARTYVAFGNDGRVWGYYALAPGEVSPEQATDRAKKGLASHPLPAILLARLACDQRAQGVGLGKALLKHALRQSLLAYEVVGARVILVHAINEEARSFYAYFGFELSPVHPFTLMLLMKDVRALAQ